MTSFVRSVVSIPGNQRRGRTPFGAPMVIHATAPETGGALGAWDTITPAGQGPARHTHTREIEFFLVLEGDYHFECGDDAFEASAGTVVVLPPHVPHKWWNAGAATGRMLVVVTPGGFEQMFLDILDQKTPDPSAIARIEHRYGLANDETPVVGLVQDIDPARAPFPRAIVSRPTDPANGRTARGDDVLVRVRSGDTAGRLGAWVATIAPGTGPAWHTHSLETELFAVISGTFRFWCGPDSFIAPPGSVIALPPHVPHQWLNTGTEPGRLFGLVTPGGFEQMFIDFRAMDGVSPAQLVAAERALGVTGSPPASGVTA